MGFALEGSQPCPWSAAWSGQGAPVLAAELASHRALVCVLALIPVWLERRTAVVALNEEQVHLSWAAFLWPELPVWAAEAQSFSLTDVPPWVVLE